jgi:hypothetical protein
MLLRVALVGAFFLVACNSKDGGKADSGMDAQGVTFSYAPQGCGYTVSPPAERGFVDLALDEDKPLGDVAGATPLRVRIGLGGGTTKGAAGYADPTTSAVFTWESATGNHAAKVKIGTAPNALTDTYKGYTWTTPPPERGLGTTDPPGYMHEVHVCGLTPATTYYYQVGGGAPGAEAWSATQSLTTVPASGPILVGVSGDARDNADTWQLVQRRMKDAGVAIQLFSGDLVLSGMQESLFSKWLDVIWKDPMMPGSFITLGQQMMVLVGGNHEGMSSQFYGNFSMPGDGPWAETYGSFDIGTAHVAFVDDQMIASNGNADEAKAQLEWLKTDLDKASKDRAAHPFIIVMHHRSIFSTSNHSSDTDVVRLRQIFMPIFDQYGVDLVLGGHDHDYERSKPIKGPPDNPTVQMSSAMGTTYVVSAGAGADPYSPGTAPAPYRELNAAYGGSTGYVGVYTILRIDGNSLRVTTRGLRPSASNVMGDGMIDDFTLSR